MTSPPNWPIDELNLARPVAPGRAHWMTENTDNNMLKTKGRPSGKISVTRGSAWRRSSLPTTFWTFWFKPPRVVSTSYTGLCLPVCHPTKSSRPAPHTHPLAALSHLAGLLALHDARSRAGAVSETSLCSLCTPSRPIGPGPLRRARTRLQPPTIHVPSITRVSPSSPALALRSLSQKKTAAQNRAPLFTPLLLRTVSGKP